MRHCLWKLAGGLCGAGAFMPQSLCNYCQRRSVPICFGMLTVQVAMRRGTCFIFRRHKWFDEVDKLQVKQLPKITFHENRVCKSEASPWLFCVEV